MAIHYQDFSRGLFMSSILRKTAVAAAFALATTVAYADQVNTRPYNPGPTNLDALQSVFTNIGSSINVYNEQDPGAIFSPTGFGVSAGSYVASVTWGFTEELGLYKYGDVGTNVKLFSAATSTPGSRVSMVWNAAGDVAIYDADTLALIDSQVGLGFNFGMYFVSNNINNDPYPGVFFTEDSLNGGNVQALVYEGNGDTVTIPGGGGSLQLNDVGHYYVAWEGVRNNGVFPFGEGSIDWNDAVVMLESVTPVPEPETYAMLLAGLGLMGFVARRRRLKATA